MNDIQRGQTETMIDELLKQNVQRARESLYHFIKIAWHVVEPGVIFKKGWHLEAICKHLEAVYRGDIKKLIINIPPRHGKSIVVSIMYPAWVWLQNPTHKFFGASWAFELAKMGANRSRDLIDSEWYKSTFELDWSLSSVQNEKMDYHNTKSGFRKSVSVGSIPTGFGCDTMIIDDPNVPGDYSSSVRRDEVIDWYKTRFSSRVNDIKTVARIVVMQRLHEQDFTGFLLEQGGWEHLKLPAEYEGDKRQTCIGWSDPRLEIGEALWPAKIDKAGIAEFRKGMFPQEAAGQLQQRPAPIEGNLIKREWFKPYTVLPSGIHSIVMSWDLTFKDTNTADFVVGTVWGQIGAHRYLIDMVRGRMGFTDSLAAIKSLAATYTGYKAILIEEAANGAAVIDSITNTRGLRAVVPVKPDKSKQARVMAIAAEFQAGDFFFPDSARCGWMNDVIEEFANFPNGRNDDIVDSISQALIWMKSEVEMIDIGAANAGLTKASIADGQSNYADGTYGIAHGGGFNEDDDSWS